jgi:uncharacterized delta-60 repeat protein
MRTLRAAMTTPWPALITTALAVLVGAPPAHAQDGWPDPGFGTNGNARLYATGLSSAFRPDENDARWTSVVEQPDGSTLLAGHVGYSDAGKYCYETIVARLREDGSPDPSFGNGGHVTLLPGCSSTGHLAMLRGDNDTGLQRIVLQPDGRIVGYTVPYNHDSFGGFVLFRLLADGSRDPSFGTLGVRYESLPQDWISGWPELVPADLALQPDGRVVLAGTVYFTDRRDADFVVARFMPDGSPDVAFGIRGFALVDFAGSIVPLDRAAGMAIQADGRIVVAGTVNGVDPDDVSDDVNIGVARLMPNGYPDPSFGSGGRSVLYSVGFRGETFAASLALELDGDIVVSGLADRGGFTPGADIVVARLLPNGAFDPSFGFGGWAPVGYSDVLRVSRVAVQADGKLVVAATRETGGVVVRLLPEGGADLEFGAWGSTEIGIGLPIPANDLTLGWMGRMLVAGGTGAYFLGNQAANSPELSVSRLTNWVKPVYEWPGR